MKAPMSTYATLVLSFNSCGKRVLFLKQSKCTFSTTSVADLGHVISAAMDVDKVCAIVGRLHVQFGPCAVFSSTSSSRTLD